MISTSNAIVPAKSSELPNWYSAIPPVALVTVVVFVIRTPPESFHFNLTIEPVMSIILSSDSFLHVTCNLEPVSPDTN